jgi:hypothetical protein
MRTIRQSAATAAICILTLFGTACSTVYYRAMEQFGIEKRDILIDRIEAARDSQADAKEQFTTALDRYRSVVSIDGGDLEQMYDRLNREFEASQREAQRVADRIRAVEAVADDLFEEWENEIEDYSDPQLRRQSQRLLTATRADYRDLIGAMRRAEQSMAPVLTLFQDQVLFLRHNLNARAIGSLENELADIERATATLVAEMERAIEEASRFVAALS